MSQVLGLAVVLALLPRCVIAQGTCEFGQATAVLDVGNVEATVLNTGGLFYGNGVEHAYYVPKGFSPIYAAGFWVGGRAGGELRVSGATFLDFAFWPGPLDAEGQPPTDCVPFDRIYEVTRQDIERLQQTGTVSENLRAWPAELAAPVLDGDGVAGNYNPEGGDIPALKGDQMLWWVMNDQAGEREEEGFVPVGLEVQVSVFAFGFNDEEGYRLSRQVQNTTFYEYRLTYHGDVPLEEAWIAFWADPDLGDAGDDYVGSDSALHLAYSYNADGFDSVYGVPPAVGIVTMQGPTTGGDDTLGMERTIFFVGGGPHGTELPRTAEGYYNVLRGLWRDGMPLTWGEPEGPMGRGGTRPAHFHFPSPPGEYWSEFDADGRGSANRGGDRTFMTSSGPFRMEPGQVQTVRYAIVWAQGSDHLDSVARLKALAGGVRIAGEALFAPRLQPRPPFEPEQPTDLFGLYNYPNPFRGATTIRYALDTEALVRLSVYDVLGREVAVLVDDAKAAGVYEVEFEASGLGAGVYLGRLVVGGRQVLRRLVVLP